ncbi:MAG: T9SS type A sorting domain-containing protein [Bacteroidetes bacterium]|nr:T9SS type A sorting domain-containing protein [Bacteroidota bacterium]
MKKYLFLFLLFIVVASSNFLKNGLMTERDETENEGAGEQGESHARFPDENFQFSAPQFYSVLHQVEQMPTDKHDRSVNSWEFIGPDTMIVTSNVNFCGRARCVQAFNPQNPEDLGIRVSTATGGLWNMKNVNGQIIAESLQGDLPIGDVPAFDIYPGYLDTMIAGTGEPGANAGVGLFITYDGGLHWEQTNTSYPVPLCYHKVLFNPEHPDTVFAASSSGLFRSTDGGYTWNSRLSGDVTDFAFNPQHPDTVYACRIGGGFFLSTDAGTSFNYLSSPPIGFGHTCLAVAPSSPNILFTCIITGLNETQIYKSIDWGGSWNRCHITNFQGKVDTFSIHWNQGYYNNCITINPTDANMVIIGAGDVSRSVNGTDFYEGQGADGHHDHHGFAWQSDGSLLDANDGGLFVSYDNGATMNSSLNHLPVAQFYSYDLCDYYPQAIIGSLQDNGTVTHKFSGGKWIWMWNIGGDGFSCGINPAYEQDVMTHYNDLLEHSFNGGNSWTGTSIPGITPSGWYLPKYERGTSGSSPAKNGAYVKGFKQLFKRDSLYNWSAVNTGNEFTNDIWHYALGNRNTTDDLQNILVSMPAASTEKIYICDRTNTFWYNISHNLPFDNTEQYGVATAYFNNDISYAFTVSGDSAGKVYMNNDIGVTDWIDITGNLPRGMRINCLANNPYNPNEVFVGTYRFGVFRTIVGTNVWTHWVNGWPSGMDISGLEVVDSSATSGKMFLEASSYGRGIWRREITGEDPSAVTATAVETNFALSNFPLIKSGNEIAVSFETEKAALVKIELYDLSGHLLQTVCNQKYEAGNYSLPANSNSLSSGIYLCSMLVNEKSRVTKKLVVVN